MLLHRDCFVCFMCRISVWFVIVEWFLKIFKDKKFIVHPVGLLIWIWLFIVLGILPALSYFLAIFIHEAGHYLTAQKCGYRLSKFSISPYGVALSYLGQNIEKNDEIKIALAGPAFNLFSAFVMLGVWWIFPDVYVFTDAFVTTSVCLALVNLLPVYPLDGGRVFVCISSGILNKNLAKKITLIFNFVLAFFFFVLFIVFCFINFNPTYFLFAFFLLLGMLDLNFVSKYEKINIFKKDMKNFVKPRILCVNQSVTIKDLLAKVQTNHTVLFCVCLENGRVVNLSEKMLLRLSLNFPYETKLEEIFKWKVF